LGLLAILASVLWLWGEIEGVDRVLYFYSEIFHLGECNSGWFFYEFSWTKAGGSAFTLVVCGGYGGVEPNVEFINELGFIDRIFGRVQG